MLTMLVEGPDLDIKFNKWTECRFRILAATRLAIRSSFPGASMMEILSHPFTSDTNSFEAFDAKLSMHERKTSKAIDTDVKVGVVLKIIR